MGDETSETRIKLAWNIWKVITDHIKINSQLSILTSEFGKDSFLDSIVLSLFSFFLCHRK